MSNHKMKLLKILSLSLLLNSCSTRPADPKIEPLNSPTKSLLQAISIFDKNTTWLSGHNGSFVRTNNGGVSWELFTHPTGDTLQFRDIHALDANTVMLMSAGPGSLSRIFSFQAPDRWEENFVMQDSLGFLDCMDFWDNQRGIAYGDAIDKYPYILLTSDGGKTWVRADSTRMPVAGKGEGGFAASGTCVTTGENGKAWIATGAGGHCRLLITADYGISWKELDSPLVSGEVAGNTSVSFIGEIGIVAGGDLLKPDEYTDNSAFSKDGGQSWKLTNQPQTSGPFYGSAITAIDDQIFAFVCGPSGLEYTKDSGQTWNTLDTINYWAVSMKGNTGFASGKDGKNFENIFAAMRRPRRNRRSAAIRDLTQETTLTTNDFIFPLFLLEGTNKKSEVKTMPGIFRLSEDLLLKEIEASLKMGIKAFDVFPVVEEKHKDKTATKSYDPNFFYLKTLTRIKKEFPQALIITDVAMDPYSSDGHDGIVEDGKNLK